MRLTIILEGLISALLWAAISFAIIGPRGFALFCKIRDILDQFRSGPAYSFQRLKDPKPTPFYLVPLFCAPCFSFWATFWLWNPSGPGAWILSLGFGSVSYIASKVIHNKI